MRRLALLITGAHALAKPPAVVGQKLHDVATPALLLDADAFERNCETLRSAIALTGVRARPHMKAHKSGALAKRQLELLDVHASGVCAQTVAELEAAVRAWLASSEAWPGFSRVVLPGRDDGGEGADGADEAVPGWEYGVGGRRRSPVAKRTL